MLLTVVAHLVGLGVLVALLGGSPADWRGWWWPGDDGGGGGPGRSPSPSGGPASGPPLGRAVPASLRLRGPGRLADARRRERRPAREPARTPQRERL